MYGDNENNARRFIPQWDAVMPRVERTRAVVWPLAKRIGVDVIQLDVDRVIATCDSVPTALQLANAPRLLAMLRVVYSQMSVGRWGRILREHCGPQYLQGLENDLQRALLVGGPRGDEMDVNAARGEKLIMER